MTEHRREFLDLRVGARVTLRDWQGNNIEGAAFLSPAGAWLCRTPAGQVVPITPRELIRVADGAAQKFNTLREGARVTLADWEGGKVAGIARPMCHGAWECVAADGARWLIEPYRLIEVSP
jgi:hypothetical protein